MSYGMTHAPSRIRSVFTVVGLTYGSFAVGNIIVLGTILTLSGIGISVTTRPSLQLLLSTVLLQGVAFGGIAIVYVKVRNLGWEFVSFAIPDVRDLVVTLAGTVALFGLLFAVSLILTYLGLEVAQNRVMGIGQRNPAVFLLLVPLSFLLIGPAEELLFRGLVQGTLRESFHPSWAVVIASALFASTHLFALTGDGKAESIGLVFVLALVLGVAYEYTGNLTVPALIHGAYNAVQFASAYLSVTAAG